jgi:hypothetical protein
MDAVFESRMIIMFYRIKHHSREAAFGNDGALDNARTAPVKLSDGGGGR